MPDKKYVIFRLSDEEYGINIMRVKEVTDLVEITKLPNTPDFVEGVINLRGDITPIINLKKRFSKFNNDISSANRVLVINIEDKLIGFIVDDASQVITIEDSQIQNTPDIVVGDNRRYIEGIAKVDKRMIIMLDLIKVLSEEEKKELLQM